MIWSVELGMVASVRA